MEGYLDVARALEAGVEEVVATCGTALTPGHARLLRRFTERVVVNFDQDAAGQRGGAQEPGDPVGGGLTVQVVELPDGHDPDTFLKAEGADAYRRRLEEAPAFMDWLIRRAAAENEMRTPAGKAAYLNALLPILARIENAVERAAWLPAIVERGGLDERAAQEELRRALAMRATSVALPAPGARRSRPAHLLSRGEIFAGPDHGRGGGRAGGAQGPGGRGPRHAADGRGPPGGPGPGRGRGAGDDGAASSNGRPRRRRAC